MTTSVLALVVVCGVNGPSMSDPEGGGRRGGHQGWLAMDNGATVTPQKWQRCRKSKVAKQEGGGVLYVLISCSQVAHLGGLNFTSRNQYKITKSTAKKDFCTS